MISVLYHKNCHDGMMSAVIFSLLYKATKQEAEFIAVSYGATPPDVTGKDVMIVDFSYPPEILAQMGQVAKSLVMLDHHLTAANAWGGYKRFTHRCSVSGCDMHIVLDEHLSGAGLAIEYADAHLYSRLGPLPRSESLFSEDKRIYKLAMAVQDRDLWKFKLPDTPAIHEALSALPLTVEEWERFATRQTRYDYDAAIAIGASNLVVKEKLAQDYAARHQLVVFSGQAIPVVNCPSNFASRVGEILSEHYPYALTWVATVTKVYVSLRSRKAGMNVQQVASAMGGGGHAQAAGFTHPLATFSMLFTDIEPPPAP